MRKTQFIARRCPHTGRTAIVIFTPPVTRAVELRLDGELLRISEEGFEAWLVNRDSIMPETVLRWMRTAMAKAVK